jgi:hypothetical protein
MNGGSNLFAVREMQGIIYYEMNLVNSERAFLSKQSCGSTLHNRVDC